LLSSSSAYNPDVAAHDQNRPDFGDRATEASQHGGQNSFPFAEAKDAYRHFEGRGHFGKVVITHV
jgi:hypothetical protein